MCLDSTSDSNFAPNRSAFELHSAWPRLKERFAADLETRGLTEECIVVIRSIDDEAVERSALSGKTNVSRANVARHSGSEQNEVDEVPAVDRQIGHGAVIDRRADLRP